MRKNVFLFGGEGYIGKNLKEYFTEESGSIRIITDPIYAQTVKISHMIHLASPRKKLKVVVGVCDVSPVKGLRQAYTDWMNKFEACIKDGAWVGKKLGDPNIPTLYFSTQSVYDRPRSLYGQMKEMADLEYHAHTIVHPGTVFGVIGDGPLRIDTAINGILYRLSQRKSAYVTDVERCWTPMHDVCLGVERFVNGDIAGCKKLLDCTQQGKLKLSRLFNDILEGDTKLVGRKETGCALHHSIPRCKGTNAYALQLMLHSYYHKFMRETDRSLI